MCTICHLEEEEEEDEDEDEDEEEKEESGYVDRLTSRFTLRSSKKGENKLTATTESI